VSTQPPIQTTSTFNIQNLVTPGSVLLETPLDVSRMIFMLYQDVEQQINRADLKSQITLSTSTILAALAVNLGLGFSSTVSQWHAVEWMAMVLYGLCAVALCAAIAFAVAAAYPRSVGKEKELAANPNLYFTADLIRLDPDDYVRRFCAQTNEDLKERVLRQIHVKSRVLEAKLSYVRRGLRLMVLGILCWGAAHAALVLAGAHGLGK
jgi:hypothetical protein